MPCKQRFPWPVLLAVLATGAVTAAAPPRIGVLEGRGAVPLRAVLQGRDDLQVVRIAEITPEALAACDVLLVTQQPQAPAWARQRDLAERLIAWVQAGGGVMLLHDAVGYREHPALFPTIGRGHYHPKLDRVRVTRTHPVTAGLTAGYDFSPGFMFDHVAIDPGPAGLTVIANLQEQPVVVVGALGAGRVMLNGMHTGHWGLQHDGRGREMEPEGSERTVLVNGLLWLAGRPRALHAAVPLPASPEGDGPVVDDPAWQDIAAAGGDFIRLGDRQRAEKQTFFRVGYSPHALYIAVRCEEPEPERLVAEYRDGRALLTDDSIEVFLQPAADPSYYRFAVSAAGARSSTVFTGSAADRLDLPLEFWAASAQRADDHWSVVLRLPYELFESLPDAHETWAFNVNRNVSSTKQRELHTWSARVHHSFHEVEHFGALRFSGRRMEAVVAAKTPESAVFLYARPAAGTVLRTGRREQRISYAQAGHTAPRKSPVDGSILYHSRLEGSGQVGIRWWNPDAQTSIRWCDGRDARWHPAGDRLVFERDGQVIERHTETGHERVVSPAGWQPCRYPSYAGKESILFAARVDGAWGLYLAGVETGRTAPRRLVPLRDAPYSAAAMAPDGGAVAYPDGGALYLLSLQDGSMERLTRAPGVQGWPAWAQDGSAIAFLQAPEQGRGPKNLYLVRLDTPEQMFLLNRDIHPGFDWNGILPDLPRGEALRGAPPIQALEGHAKRLSNDWMTLELRPGASAVRLASQDGTALKLAFHAPDTQAPGVVQEATIRAETAGTLRAGVAFGTDSPDRTTAHFVLPGYRPLLEIRPESGIARTTLHVNFDALLQPDRLASDLVLEPATKGMQRLVLPPGPVLIGCESAGAAMLLLVTPAQQEVHVHSRDGRFHAIDIVTPTEAAGGGKVETGFFLAWLEDALYRPRLEAAPGNDEKALHLEWAQPYQAHWRVSLAGRDTGYATFLRGEALAERSEPHVALTPPEPDAWQSAYVYLHGRTAHTPLGNHTLMDVVTGALGVDAAHALLHTAAARNYRLAAERVPRWLYENFFIERPDKAGPHSVFGNRVRITAETTSLAIHLHDDVVGLLAGLDKRLEEYRKFIATLGPQPHGLQAQRETLEDDLAENRFTAIDSFRLTREQLEDVRGVMARHPVYREFLEAGLAAFDARTETLAACRRFIQAVRTQAGLEILQQPERRKAGAALRQAAGDILGRRYYFEGDWRGEYPGEEIQ